jgi:hypothetical protein
MRIANAARDFDANEIVFGAKDANGYPTWLGYTGINAQIDGSTTVLWMKISGYMVHIRNIKQISFSGGAGVYYLYADHDPINGELVIDGDSTTAPPSTATGTVGSDTSKVRVFEDLTHDFTSENVRPGDILEILGTSSNAGKYVIKDIAPDGNAQRVRIMGIFPGGAMTGLDYKIWDKAGVTVGFQNSKTSVANRIYFAEADWDGASITAVRSLNFDSFFIGEWRGVDVTVSPTFTETWRHNLFDDAVMVKVQVSSANNGSQPIEELSLGIVTNTLGVSTSNSLTLTPATPQVLGGTITTSLTGSAVNDRSIALKWDKYTATVKNLLSNVFYRDYDGVLKQTGYVRVIISKIRK